MNKIIAMLFVLALCVPSAFAGVNDQPNSVANASFTTVYSTPSTSTCELAYILIDSTGTAAAVTLTIRDGATTKFTITSQTTAGTKVYPLGDYPVLFASNLNVVASIIDTSLRYSIVYQKRN